MFYTTDIFYIGVILFGFAVMAYDHFFLGEDEGDNDE